MNFLVDFNALDTETLDTKILDIWMAQPVWKHLETSMLCTEDVKLLKDDICSSNILPSRKSSLRFHDLDYDEKIKELQCFLDSVKKIASPGCSQEVLNVALSLMSTFVGILSAMSLEQYPHASL